MQAWVQFGVPMEQLGPIFERLVENVQVKNLFRRERTLVLGSIIVRWQHLSKTKISCYSRLEKLNSLLKMQQAISGTSTATYKLTEPYSALTKKSQMMPTSSPSAIGLTNLALAEALVLSIKKLYFPTGRGVVRRGFGRSELDRQPPRHAQLPQPLEGPLEADPELAAHPGAADERGLVRHRHAAGQSLRLLRRGRCCNCHK